MAEQRILFSLPSLFTHVAPFLGVARQLAARGHRLAFASNLEGLEEVLAHGGLTATCFGSRPHNNPRTASARRRDSDQVVRERARDPRWQQRLRDFHQQVVVPAEIANMRRAVDEFRPDVVCANPFSFAGALVAEEARLPWASVSVNLLYAAPDDWCESAIGELRRLGFYPEEHFAQRGLQAVFKSLLIVSPWLNTLFATRDFLGDLPASLSEFPFHFVGPSPSIVSKSRDDFPWHKLRSDVPIIYVSHGTMQGFPPSVFEALVHAVRPDEAQLVIGLFDVAPDPKWAALPHVVAVRYVPQLALLERSAIMVSHGGANSVMEALRFRRPLLIIPLGYDNELQARFVERSGAGVVARADELTVERARAHLMALLDPKSRHVERATAIGNAYAQHDGAAITATLLAELAETRRPVWPTQGQIPTPSAP